MDATTWAAIGTWFTAAIYIAILVYAVRQVTEAKRQVAEAKELRHSQTRPFVVIDLDPGFLMYLKFENIGATMARNVRFSFEPKLEVATTGLPNLHEVALLQDGLESFPPKKSYRLFFDVIEERTQNRQLPMKYRATAFYEDDEGREYRDQFTIDISAILDTPTDDKGIPDLVKEIAEMRKEMRKWTDGVRGILVHAKDKDEMDRVARQRYDERRKQLLAEKEKTGDGES